MDDSPITRGLSRLESGEVKENYLSLLLAVGCWGSGVCSRSFCSHRSGPDRDQILQKPLSEIMWSGQ
jgi:hypothetical protein